MEILYFFFKLCLRLWIYVSLTLEITDLGFGLYLRPEARSSSSTSFCIGTKSEAKGLWGRAKPKSDPVSGVQGFLTADRWESQGNPPSTPAPVIWPSMCQSRRTRWQARDDMAIVLSPFFAAWTSQTQENIPVIMAFQCHLACWVWPEPRDWQWRDNMFVSFAEFIGKGWGFWHTRVQWYKIKLVCGSERSVHIYILAKTMDHE